MTALPVTSGLAIDLAGGTLSTTLTDGQTFLLWPDSSGQGYDAQRLNNGPFTYKASVTPIGGPAIRFANNLTAGFSAPPANTASPIFNSSTGAEIFCVLHDTDTSDLPGFYRFGGNNNTEYPFTDGKIYDGSFTSDRFNYAPTIDLTTWHIYNVRHDGTTRTAAINGTTIHTVDTPFVNPSASSFNLLRLGGTGSVAWRGEIAEFVVYNRCLTATERTAVYNYLTYQYLQVFVDPNLNVPPIKLGTAIKAAQTTETAPSIAVGVRFNPASIPDVNLTAPAIPLGIGVGASVVDIEPLSVVPVSLGVGISARIPLIARPISAGIGISGFTSYATLSLTSPADTESVEISTPQFIVALNSLQQTAGYVIEVQYAADQDFTSATTLTATATAVDGGAFLAATDAASGTTFWRARLLNEDGTEELPWSAAQSFTVDIDLTPASTAVTWTVGATDRQIHLWHLDPSAAGPGDTVTAYGQGFPAHGNVLFDNIPVTITRWQLMPAQINSISAGRTIDVDDVDPEHYEVDFKAPYFTGPGAALQVTT